MKTIFNITKLVSLFLIISILLIAFDLSIFAETENDNEYHIYISTETTVKKGKTYTANVYIDSLLNISTLSLSIYHDFGAISIKNVYNNVSNIMYDNSYVNNQLKYIYLFDGSDQGSNINLFSFTFSINPNVDVGDYYFDVVIEEVLNAELEDINVIGQRKHLTIIDEKPVTKTCSISGTYNVNTKINQEFEITYRVNENNIASGTFEIEYNEDDFELIGVDALEFLNGKIYDINSNLRGSIYVTFVSNEYSLSYQYLIRIRFKMITNEDKNSPIKLIAKDLYDLELERVNCNGFDTTVNIAYDNTYKPNVPCMRLLSSIETDTLKLIVKLDANSHLGAGDFEILWNEDIITYKECIKGFNPTFFNVNLKHVDSNVIKFSIISLDEIVDEKDVLEISFDYITPVDDTEVMFNLFGSGISDSLTNPIELNTTNSQILIKGLDLCDNVSTDTNISYLRLVALQYDDISQIKNKLGCEKVLAYDISLRMGNNIVVFNDTIHLLINLPNEYNSNKCKIYYINGENLEYYHYVNRTDKGIDFNTSHLGIIVVAEYNHMFGDINGDGKLNNKDLTTLFRHLSYLQCFYDENALDVNGDGKSNNKDLIRLMQYLSGYDVVIY